MTNADKMFEELGYSKMDKNTFIEYYKATIHIIFAKFDKEIAKYDLGGSSYIDIPELKAINEKVKELGWYD